MFFLYKLSQNDVIDNREIYLLGNFARSLDVHSASLKSVYSAFFYIENKQWVLKIGNSSTSDDANYYSSSLALEDYYNILNLDCSLSEWKKLISVDTKNFIVPVKQKNGETYFLYVSKDFFYRNYKNNNVAFCALIRKDEFENVLNGAKVVIKKHNSDKQININNDLQLQKISHTNHTSNLKINGEKYIYSAVKSKAWDVEYIVLSSEKEVLSVVEQIKRIHLIMIVILLLISCVISYFLAYKNSRSLIRLIDVLDTNVFKINRLNFFDEIEKSIFELRKDYSISLARSLDQVRAIKESYLIRMCLTGSENVIDLNENLIKYNLKFGYPHYSVLIIYPQTTGNYQLYFTVINDIIDSMKLQCDFFLSKHNKLLLCVLNYSRNENGEMPEEIRIAIEELMNNIRERIGKVMEEDIYFTISDSVSEISNLSLA